MEHIGMDVYRPTGLPLNINGYFGMSFFAESHRRLLLSNK